jgi:UDP-N-acetylglucosamine 2-epimerase (non-hydrolysing)
MVIESKGGAVMKLMLVAGARPNFMKIASIVDAIHAYNATARRPLAYLLVHTGQHYDDKMSNAFFKDLALPKPAVDLGVGSASHAVQTAEVMRRFEPVLLQERPDAVVVVGDVNSTLACSLVVSKTIYPEPLRPSGRHRPFLVHVEAGLRSHDWSMPEEINRVVTDVLSDVLFVTEAGAIKNLRREGIPRERIHFAGNTMVDTLLKHRRNAQESTILQRLGLQDPETRRVERYALVTLHRPSNVDDPRTFQEILRALATVSSELPILFPAHPRTVTRINEFGFSTQCHALGDKDKLDRKRRGLFCMEPLGYLDFLCMMSNASLVLTDSGGIQEETTVLGVPCVTLRNNTERPVTLTQGTNVVAGTRHDAIVAHAFRQLRSTRRPQRPKFWDGRAGTRIVRILAAHLARSREYAS